MNNEKFAGDQIRYQDSLEEEKKNYNELPLQKPSPIRSPKSSGSPETEDIAKKFKLNFQPVQPQHGPTTQTGRSGGSMQWQNQTSSRFPVGASMNLNDSFSTVNHSIYQNPGEMMAIHDLKKEMRRKEQEFQKQNAVLKQQVQLLEMQAKDYEQREQKLKKMHETMLKAVQDETTNNRSSEIPKQELEELQQKHQKQVRELQMKVKESEFKSKNQAILMEEQEIASERKIQDLQLDKRNLENKIKKLQNQLATLDSADEMQIKINQQEQQIEELQIKVSNFNQNEKLEIGQFQHQITHFKAQIESFENQIYQKDKQIAQKQQKIENLQETTETLERQIEEMEQQIEDLTRAVTEDRDSFRSGMQIERLKDENEYLNNQLSREQETIKTQQEQIKKYQNIENLNHKEIIEMKARNEENESERTELKKQILSFKTQFEEKDNQVKKLQQELEMVKIGCDFHPPKAGIDENSRDITLNLNISQYPSNSHNQCAGMLAAEDLYDLPRQFQKVNFSNSNILIGENTETDDKIVQIPLSELDLLQSCQKIIDAAQSMKCIECHKIFQTTDFYDHIIVQRECVVETERSDESPTKDIENSDFYQALNMPLQVKEEQNYQTHSNTAEENQLKAEKRLSSPNKINTQINKSSILPKSKKSAKRYGSRSGHTGMTGTVNSHILMSLSRSVSSDQEKPLLEQNLLTDENQTSRRDENEHEHVYLVQQNHTTTNNLMSCPSEEEDAEDGNNMLSQSLRDIVYNNNDENEIIPQNLEKIYDLDTSRFEEEYSNLPSSKKKQLLNSLEEEEKVGKSQTFLDQSKFNVSEVNKFEPKTVSLDLVSAMKKASNTKYDQMPRQLKSSSSFNKFEKSQNDSLNNSKPKFDLSKQFNEMNKKKSMGDLKKEIPTLNISKASSKRESYRKMNLNIQIEDNNFEADLDQPVQIQNSDLDYLMKQKHVMESFRNHQIKLLQTGIQPTDAPIPQQFQSVSSKNGTQNFDFGNKDLLPSSRRHAHNRYNKNGFMLVTSQSSPSDENISETAGPEIAPQFFGDTVSPKNNVKYGEEKTVEQVNLRQMQRKVLQTSAGPQMTDRRMDTSGYNLGSEFGSSPLAKKMMQNNPIKVMKNLTCHQINEVEKSEQYTIEENDDICQEMMHLQQSEDEGEDGFISHRHYLGSDGRIFTPTLMASREDPRRQILMSQNSQLTLQHTQQTDELIRNFERRQQRDLDAKGDTQLYYAGNTGPKVNMNTKSSHKSPKNSDYIRGSILLFSGKSQKKSGRKPKNQGPDECPSFFDEFEFEEDPPVPQISTKNLYEQFLQSQTPSNQVNYKLDQKKQKFNITNDNQRIQSLLKNSLFHNHTQRSRTGSNYNTNQPTFLNSQRQNENDLSYQTLNNNNSIVAEKSQSALQTHLNSQLQRNKSKTKKQNIDAFTLNQSIGIINKPMLSQCNSSMALHPPQYLNETDQSDQNASETKVPRTMRVLGPEYSNMKKNNSNHQIHQQIVMHHQGGNQTNNSMFLNMKNMMLMHSQSQKSIGNTRNNITNEENGTFLSQEDQIREHLKVTVKQPSNTTKSALNRHVKKM